MNRYAIPIFFAFVISISPVAGETLTCSYTESLEEGHSYGVELELTLEHGRVTGLVYSGFYSNGEEGGAYPCNLDTNDIEFPLGWTQKKEITILTILETDRTDVLEIEKKDNGFEIRFVDMGRYYCGFGAEFPAAVTIERNNTECRVTKY
jgi:hypothetical protein